MNVSRFGNNSYRFVHAGGVDDVLMARFYPGSGTQVQELFFVTDGQGRELVSADFTGSREQLGWGDGSLKWAGLTAKGSSFDATRMGNSNTPGVSLFRNRSYDANSGRWLQEDPIGIAGGINLYQFNGNNPVSYTDPFGLSPDEGGTDASCPKSWTEKKCRKWVQDAIKKLKSDTAQVCRDRGRVADSLNKAGQIQFDRNTSDYGYVNADPDPVRAATGASVPPIFLGPPSFANRKETRNTIAHETTHIVDPSSGQPQNDVPGGTAYQIGDKCGQ